MRDQYRYGKVVALRIAQDDHLEEEEAFVLPLIHRRIPEAHQLEMTRRRLIDVDGSDQGWVMDWVAGHLIATEREVLAALAARVQEMPAGLSEADGQRV